MQFRKIKYKLLTAFLLIGVLPIAITLYLNYNHVANLLRNRSFEQLTTVREMKKKEIEAYFKATRQEIRFLAQDNSLVNAMKDFKKAFDKIDSLHQDPELRKNIVKYYQEELLAKLEYHERDTINIKEIIPKSKRSIFLQSQYLVGNKNQFVPNEYQEVHEKYHNNLSNFLETYNYYDIFLVDDESGYIIYSVVKEVDFATSLLSDAHKNTNIAKLFRKLRYSGVKDQVLMVDFEQYLPSFLAPAAFLATPIFEGEEKIGTLIFQIPINQMDDVMTNHKSWREEGFGETGESYIVGQDYKMRSNSRFIIENYEGFTENLTKNNEDSNEVALIEFYKTTVLFKNIRSEAVEKAISNRKGTKIIEDYRGVDVLSSFAPLNIPDVDWVIVSEIDADEVFAPMYDFAQYSVITLLLLLVVTSALSFFIAYSISQPILDLVEKTKEMKEGNLDIQVAIRSKDEIGILAQSFNENAQTIKQKRQDLLEKQREIEQQMEEITKQAQALQEMNEEVAVQNEELKQNMEEIEVQRDDILKKSSSIAQQMEEITAQSEALKEANQEIGKQRDDMLSSIVYAKRIQNALLPPREIIEKLLPNVVLFYQPRDIISGDFYWLSNTPGLGSEVILAVADCTGHGVPGAFMTVIGENLLDQIINKDKIFEPKQILEELDQRLITTLMKSSKSRNQIHDGMDIALLKIDLKNKILTFAGARSPLWIFEKNTKEYKICKGDKFPIGSHSQYEEKYFNQKKITLKEGDSIYAFSDGYQDQFGSKGKLMVRRFRQTLQRICTQPPAKQEQLLEEGFKAWQGEEKQTDDVLVVGIQV